VDCKPAKFKNNKKIADCSEKKGAADGTKCAGSRSGLRLSRFGAFLFFDFQPPPFRRLHIVIKRIEVFQPDWRAIAEIENTPQFVSLSPSGPTRSDFVSYWHEFALFGSLRMIF
jgi:hypothetical protein